MRQKNPKMKTADLEAKKAKENHTVAHSQFLRMNDKMRRRITLNECVEKMIPEAQLHPSPKHESGHPYDFDKEIYLDPVPIPRDLTD